MYEDSWYSYVPEAHSQKEDAPSHTSNHRRNESLLRQPNGSNDLSNAASELIDFSEENQTLRGPPEATLVQRAKSFSDFYELCLSHATIQTDKTNPRAAFEFPEDRGIHEPYAGDYEDYEHELLDASQEEYQLYRDQLALSERHLDSLLEDASSALSILTSLSESFKTVESQNTAFQAQCEDLLAEQKRLRILADEVGTNLQYYEYLEPLTRRLNAPGAGRLVKSNGFLDILRDLNSCLNFMHTHPLYRDSTIYKTRYMSLLERALNLVHLEFSGNLREVQEQITKSLRSKDQNETTEYVMLYGKFESALDRMGPNIQELLKSDEFKFGQKGDNVKDRTAYLQQWQQLYKSIIDTYLKSREPVSTIVLKNLKRFETSPPKPESDFKLFARRCASYVFDICHNEMRLSEKYFENGPLLADYAPSSSWDVYGNYSERLKQSHMAHISTLHNFLAPHLGNGDLHRVCDLVNWLETRYMVPVDGNEESDIRDDSHRASAQVMLQGHLWPFSDSVFIGAAKQLEHFKPSPDDLKVKKESTHLTVPSEKHPNGTDRPDSGTYNTYPTVKTAVELLIMYNDSMYDRPKKGDVLYEIVHQTTDSLQRAATQIMRSSGILEAQVFLIKNLMLIENLFMTHEIPDSIRQSAELDFSPIWDTIKELQNRRQLFNPLAYITPLVRGQLLPAVVDHLLDARKELEKVLVQQITAFTKLWQSKLAKNQKKEAIAKAIQELNALLDRAFEDDTTKAALWRMIESDEEY